jgi:hypothetical protein
MRLLDWPIGLPIVSREPLNGPRSIGESSTGSVDGYLQTSASPFGLQEWQLNLAPFRDGMARAYRGLITALHGGSNAVRVPFIDPDRYFYADLGLTGFPVRDPAHVLHSNGQPHSNLQLTRSSFPIVSLAANAARQDTIIQIQNAYWGHKIGIGTQLGFTPYHFGLYQVTEVIEPGVYRLWPPLRKAVTVDDYATLEPVMAMRLKSQGAANLPRDIAVMSGLQITLVEVPDYTLRAALA